jgi:hypothetical protein
MLDKAVEVIRSRWIMRALDAALTGVTLPAASFPDEGSARSTYYRVQFLAGKARGASPLLGTFIARLLLRTDRLPFEPRDVLPLATGAATTAYLLNGAARSEPGATYVLKTYRKTLGRSMRYAMEHLVTANANYHTVRNWYGNDNIVVPSTFVILHGPLLGSPVLACIQPYVPGRDFFSTMSQPQARKELLRDPAIRSAARAFAARTLAIAESEQRAVDILGANNLIVSPAGPDRMRLQLIDFGILDFAVLKGRAPSRLIQVRDRLRFLQGLHQEFQ